MSEDRRSKRRLGIADDESSSPPQLVSTRGDLHEESARQPSKPDVDPCNYRNPEHRGDACRRCRVVYSASALEVASISPRRELGPQWLSDANQIGSFLDACQADLICRGSENRSPKLPLAFFYRFPPLFQRCEVPSTALRADCPQPSLCTVEGKPATDRETFDRFVTTKRRMTEDAGRVQSFLQVLEDASGAENL